MFMAERVRLEQAFGSAALRVEHHGSTSVPGLAAKPIIDIQVSVAALQPLQPHVLTLATLGYVHLPHVDDERCPFFHRPADWPHTHHVHLVEAGGDEEVRTLAFRDYLRASPETAAEYERLKRRLASEADATTLDGREAYAAAKSEFVDRITRAALARAGALRL
jgi:GrpB-like predicted nucleotidyltransferase (UPF0157 family)